MENKMKLAGAIVIAAAIVLLSILYIKSLPNISVPNNISITPGAVSTSMCPAPLISINESVLSYQGFSYYNVSGLSDYVIAPGGTGTITYSMRAIKFAQDANITINQRNVTNKFGFFYNASNRGTSNFTETPIGMNVMYNPASATLVLNQSATLFNTTFAVSSNSPLGTYLIEFPPGRCLGGRFALLTVGTVPFNGTVHLIIIS